LVLVAALSAANDNSLRYFWRDMTVAWLLPIAVVVALAAEGLYRTTRHSLHPSTLSEIKDLAFGIGLGCLAALAVNLLTHAALGSSELGAAQVVATMLVAVPLVALARAALRTIHRFGWRTRVVVVGDGLLAHQMLAYLGVLRGIEPLGLVSDDRELGGEVVGRIADLPNLCRTLRVERVLVSSGSEVTTETAHALRSVEDQVRMAMVPPFYELLSWRSRMSDFFGLPIIEVAPPHLSRVDSLAKRTFDVIVAGAALVLLAPVMLTLTLAVKLGSPGPVFFRQTRVGKDRRPFTILKFRTMRVAPPAATEQPLTSGSNGAGTVTSDGAPSTTSSNGSAVVGSNGVAHVTTPGTNGKLADVRNKLAEQERVVGVGRLLRKTGLDELPQLFNVLVGHMSIVGPRPFVEEESELLTGWQARRFDVRPGITGLWQVSGRNDLSTEDLRRLDYLYVASWSLWWDVKIIWDTPGTMLKGFGAY
jgi:exopolysaccharide biosynthesis polyprenyl glycosylphosphotransferase